MADGVIVNQPRRRNTFPSGNSTNTMGYLGGAGDKAVEIQPRYHDNDDATNHAVDSELMPRPPSRNDCPPGLEYLTQLDKVIAVVSAPLVEIFVGLYGTNTVKFQNEDGQQVYYTVYDHEDSCCLTNKLTMRTADNSGKEVIRTVKEYGWKGCFQCCDCCTDWQMTVEAPVGTVIGYIQDNGCDFWPQFQILDADNQPMYTIRLKEACICHGYCCRYYSFNILNLDGEKVGSVKCRRFPVPGLGVTGYMKSKKLTYILSFPMEDDVKAKAVLQSAILFLDLRYFREPEKVKKHHEKYEDIIDDIETGMTICETITDFCSGE